MSESVEEATSRINKQIRAARAKMTEIINEVVDKPSQTTVSVNGYGGNIVTLAVSYSSPRDLTAACLEWFLDYRADDGPKMWIGDLRKTMGIMWDYDVEKIAHDYEFGRMK